MLVFLKRLNFISLALLLFMNHKLLASQERLFQAAQTGNIKILEDLFVDSFLVGCKIDYIKLQELGPDLWQTAVKFNQVLFLKKLQSLDIRGKAEWLSYSNNELENLAGENLSFDSLTWLIDNKTTLWQNFSISQPIFSYDDSLEIINRDDASEQWREINLSDLQSSPYFNY